MTIYCDSCYKKCETKTTDNGFGAYSYGSINSVHRKLEEVSDCCEAGFTEIDYDNYEDYLIYTYLSGSQYPTITIEDATQAQRLTIMFYETCLATRHIHASFFTPDGFELGELMKHFRWFQRIAMWE